MRMEPSLRCWAVDDGAENAMPEATRVTGPLTIVSVRVFRG